MSRLKALLPEGVTATNWPIAVLATSNCSNSWTALAFTMSSAFAATFTSARPMAKRGWPPIGSARADGRGKLRDAEVSAARQKVGAVVCVKAAAMKEAWHLAASDRGLSAPQIIKLYSKRWTIEPSFRDSKDLRFGMGISALRIDDPQRRDRLLLLNAFAILLLTLLVARRESLGIQRQLRTSTAKRRVHSLFRQGCLLYDLIPNMPDERLRPLVERYQELLRQSPALQLSGSSKMRGLVRCNPAFYCKCAILDD